jgi:hypothetical protein
MIDWKQVLSHVETDSRRSLYLHICQPKVNMEKKRVAIAVKPAWFRLVAQDLHTIRSAFLAEFGTEFQILVYSK